MIAAVSRFDAAPVASAGASLVAVALCPAAFAVTVAPQTQIRGT
jgi:hypothetical protein